MSAPKQRKIAIVGSRSVGQSRRHPYPTKSSLEANLGDAAGKSSLAVQFVDGHFVDSYYPTIENTFTKTIRYKGQDYATEIVDTAGQVRFPWGLAGASPRRARARAPPQELTFGTPRAWAG